MINSYTTKQSAVRAIKKQGLQNVRHFIREHDNRFQPRFFVDFANDKIELQKRDFNVTLINFEIFADKNETFNLSSVADFFDCPVDIMELFLNEAVENGTLFLDESTPVKKWSKRGWQTVGDSRERETLVVKGKLEDELFYPEVDFDLPVPHIFNDGSVDNIRLFKIESIDDYFSIRDDNVSVMVHSKEHAEALSRAILIAAEKVWGK